MTMNSGPEKNKKKKGEETVQQATDSGAPKRYSRRMGDVHGSSDGSYGWLVTFTDVMALMLTFFVLLFSMTETSKKQWDEISEAVQTEFNKFYGAVLNRGPVENVDLEKVNFNQALDLPYLAVLLETVASESKFLEGVTLTRMQGELVLSLPQDLLFDPGSADIKPEGSKALYALGGSLSRIQNKIEVVGHADPRPVSQGGQGAYDSNWELSLARAATVAGILEGVGYEKSLAIRGDSSGRYQDLAAITDEQQRLELSRRVDIVLMNHDGSKKKLFFDNNGQ